MKLRIAILGCLLTLASIAASAQCAMCAQGTSQTSQQTQRAIKRGVLLLAIPPVGFMAGFIGLAWRAGRRKNEED